MEDRGTIHMNLIDKDLLDKIKKAIDESKKSSLNKISYITNLQNN